MHKNRITKFIFTVRENTDCDSESDIPYVVWPMTDETRDRLGRLGQIARSEKVTVSTNEFLLYAGANLENPLSASMAISPDDNPSLELDMEKAVRKMWPVRVESESLITMETALAALGTPNHIKRPVAIVTNDCSTDLVVFDEDDMRDEDLSEVVQIAIRIFGEHEDGASALNEFSEASGIRNVYRFSKAPLSAK